MPNQSITKRCSHCKQVKPLFEFHKNQASKDGRQNQCKICMKESVKKYDNNPKGKATAKRYRQSERGQYTRKIHNQSEAGKRSHKQSYCKYRNQSPYCIKANCALNYAVSIGKLPRVSSLQCSYCPKQAEQYHHHKGYAREHWLDVIPVCISCHKKTPSLRTAR